MAAYRIASVDWQNRRRDQRHVSSPPIEIEIEAHRFRTRDWSLGGFAVDSYAGASLPGDRLTVTLHVNAGAESLEHRAEIEVVRTDPRTKELAARYIGLDPAAVDTLDGLLTGRLRRARRRRPAASGRSR